MRIDHIGIAVRSMEQALSFYKDALKLELTHSEELPSQGVRVAFLSHGNSEGCLVELLEPLTGSGVIAKFIASRGPGLHHLAFHSPDLLREMERLNGQGRPTVDSQPRLGARGHRVCFLHPKHSDGVLIELVG